MRADTVEQYKVLKFIEKLFNIDVIEIQLLDRYTLKVIDTNKSSIIFFYDKDSGTVKERSLS